MIIKKKTSTIDLIRLLIKRLEVYEDKVNKRITRKEKTEDDIKEYILKYIPFSEPIKLRALVHSSRVFRNQFKTMVDKKAYLRSLEKEGLIIFNEKEQIVERVRSFNGR